MKDTKKKQLATSENLESDNDNIQMFKVKINYVEDNSVVVTLGGYSKRIYFDLSSHDLEYIRDHKLEYGGKLLTIYYMGDVSNPFTVKILPVKSIQDIGSVY